MNLQNKFRGRVWIMFFGIGAVNNQLMQPGSMSCKQGAKYAKTLQEINSWNNGIFEQHNFCGCKQTYEDTKVAGRPDWPVFLSYNQVSIDVNTYNSGKTFHSYSHFSWTLASSELVVLELRHSDITSYRHIVNPHLTWYSQSMCNGLPISN